jgi:hypothetical protein
MWHYIIPTVDKTSLIINKYSNKIMIIITTTTTNEYTVASTFVNPNVLNFDLSLIPILIPLFQLFVAGSQKSGRDHMASELAFLIAQITLSSVKLHLSKGRLTALMLCEMRLSFNYLMYKGRVENKALAKASHVSSLTLKQNLFTEVQFAVG